jgi:hypothetical protein
MRVAGWDVNQKVALTRMVRVSGGTNPELGLMRVRAFRIQRIHARMGVQTLRQRLREHGLLVSTDVGPSAPTDSRRRFSPRHSAASWSPRKPSLPDARAATTSLHSCCSIASKRSVTLFREMVTADVSSSIRRSASPRPCYMFLCYKSTGRFPERWRPGVAHASRTKTLRGSENGKPRRNGVKRYARW